MFRVDKLSTRLGAFSLEDISLSIGEGECHAVLGPSGSGKSTLLGSVLGSVPVASGKIHLNGREITSWPMENRRLGYVPQHLGLFPHMSVRDNLSYSARARKLDPREFQPLLDKLIEITGIGKLLHRRIATLSGGERQRVALVRALAANPRLVLLDEPFAALNETLRRELWWLVRELQRERGLSAMLITHDLTEAYFLADQISVLIDGSQAQYGPKSAIYHHPATLAVAEFLGLKNLFSATVVKAENGLIVAKCSILGHHFTLPGRVPIGTAIRLGIRPEEVVLRDQDHPPGEDECVLTGTVRLIDLGASVVMHFHPDQVSQSIEVAASWRVINRFGLHNNQAGIRVGLPASALFWVLDE